MTSPTSDQTSARLEAVFGLGRSRTSQTGASATAWETPAFHLLWFDGTASEAELRRLWEARKATHPNSNSQGSVGTIVGTTAKFPLFRIELRVPLLHQFIAKTQRGLELSRHGTRLRFS